MNNDNQQFLQGLDPETLEIFNSFTPDSPEFVGMQQFFNKFGAKGMREYGRTDNECPIDSLIVYYNCGHRAAKSIPEIIIALVKSKCFMVYSDDRPLVLPTQNSELVVAIFTRESHVNKFINENMPETVTAREVSMADLFLKILPNRHFTLHINPEEGGGMFEIVLPPNVVNFLYNLTIHGGVETRRLCVETGKNPDELRFVTKKVEQLMELQLKELQLKEKIQLKELQIKELEIQLKEKLQLKELNRRLSLPERNAIYGYDPHKPWENYTYEELKEMNNKLLMCLLEAGQEPRPFERQLLDMVTLQQNKNYCNPANRTEAEFRRLTGFDSSSLES